MIRFSLTHAAALLGGHYDGPDGEFAAVGSDSRTLLPGSLFVALPGARFDGHDHLAQAAERGALAALVSRPVASPLPQLRVDDTRLALGRLAAAWLAAGRAARPTQVVAVTGSNGKTTVKEMLAAILAQRGPVLATRGNLNNDIGMPLTLLRLQEESFVVAEMGANHAGEIGYLSRLASPDVAVLNNAGRAHLEGFGSLEGVAMAKGEIVDGLGADGLFVFDAASPWAALWRERAAGRRILSFGVDERADLYSPAEEFRLDWRDDGFVSRFPVRGPMGGFEVELALAGVHNRQNALAATAAALGLGLTPEEIRRGWPRCDRSPVACNPAGAATGCACSTTATTPTPTPWGPPLPCWPRRRGGVSCCWGNWRSWGRGWRPFIGSSVSRPVGRGSNSSSRWGRRPPPPRVSAPAVAALRSARTCWTPWSRCCGPGTACWPRVPAGPAWKR
jgi:UDP-N-acetylmuramoyl-tripeptide--D-alanyl-D-alanine ligase